MHVLFGDFGGTCVGQPFTRARWADVAPMFRPVQMLVQSSHEHNDLELAWILLGLGNERQRTLKMSAIVLIENIDASPSSLHNPVKACV